MPPPSHHRRPASDSLTHRQPPPINPLPVGSPRRRASRRGLRRSHVARRQVTPRAAEAFYHRRARGWHEDHRRPERTRRYRRSLRNTPTTIDPLLSGLGELLDAGSPAARGTRGAERPSASRRASSPSLATRSSIRSASSPPGAPIRTLRSRLPTTAPKRKTSRPSALPACVRRTRAARPSLARPSRRRSAPATGGSRPIFSRTIPRRNGARPASLSSVRCSSIRTRRTRRRRLRCRPRPSPPHPRPRRAPRSNRPILLATTRARSGRPHPTRRSLFTRTTLQSICLWV